MYKLDKKRVVIISHVYAPGPPHELEAYLKDKVSELFFIAHPLSFVKNKPSVYRRYSNGELVENREGRIWQLPDLLLYVKDFVANLYLVGKEPRYDLVIALDNLNAASALWLRNLGRVKQVVFYTIDYIPKRFTNPLLNRLYHRLDSYAVRKSNYTWNLSPVMAEMREKSGISARFRKQQLTVPIGTHLLPVESVKKDPNLVVFMGHMREGQGVELLLEAMPLVVKELPKTKLRLIGGGPLEKTVEQQIKKLGLERSVTMTGFVPSNEEMRRNLLEGSVAAAPYVDDETTFTRYTDPGKPKEYLAAGCAVIITKVPRFAMTIEKRGAGKAINYDKNELAEAVIDLLRDPKQLAKHQEAARKLAAESTWDTVFSQAFKEMHER